MLLNEPEKGRVDIQLTVGKQAPFVSLCGSH
jgi:hypothetical protein